MNSQIIPGKFVKYNVNNDIHKDAIFQVALTTYSQSYDYTTCTLKVIRGNDNYEPGDIINDVNPTNLILVDNP